MKGGSRLLTAASSAIEVCRVETFEQAVQRLLEGGTGRQRSDPLDAVKQLLSARIDFDEIFDMAAALLGIKRRIHFKSDQIDAIHEVHGQAWAEILGLDGRTLQSSDGQPANEDSRSGAVELTG